MRGLRHKDLLFFILLSAAGTAPAFAHSDGSLAFRGPAVPSPLLARVQELVHLTPSYTPVAWPTSRPRDLLREAQRQHALNLAATSSLLNGRLRSDGALSYAAPDGSSVDQARDARHQSVRLGLTGIEGHMRYGVTYRSAGEAALADGDQEAREAWVAWSSNTLAVRTSVQQQSNNVAHHASRPRLTALQKRLALDLTLPAWPALTVAYTQGLSSSSFNPVGFSPARNQTDAVETSLHYELLRVKFHAGSVYAATEDLLRPGGSSLRLQHLVSSSYSPLASVTFSSTLSLTDNRDSWSSQRTETPSAEFAMAYRAPKDFDVSVWSSYSRTQDNWWSVDLRTFNAKSQLSWHAPRIGWSATTLRLETGYSTTADVAHSARPPDNLSAIFHLTLTGQSWADILEQFGR
ncbi:MAG: hypothetical protein ACREJU_11610 [Nitrospiraceae bacterium]